MKTTDSQDEIFPIVNKNDEVVGKITRKEAHKSPHIIHRAIAIFVFDKKGRFLIQKRSLTKDTHPDCWSDSVGGHVQYGEEYLDVAVREIQEELGIKVNPISLMLSGKMITKDSNETEINVVYKLTLKETPVIKMNTDEVAETKFVSLKVLKEMMKQKKWTPISIQLINRFLLKN